MYRQPSGKLIGTWLLHHLKKTGENWYMISYMISLIIIDTWDLVARNEVIDKAQDKREKAERLLSQVTTQVQHLGLDTRNSLDLMASQSFNHGYHGINLIVFFDIFNN